MKKFFTTLGCALVLSSIAIPANAVDMEWNTEYSITKRGDVSYSVVGKGTKATIITSETNSGNDLTMGGQDLLFKNNTPITVTSALVDGVMVYYTPELETGVTYDIEFYCNNATTTKPFTIKIVENTSTSDPSTSLPDPKPFTVTKNQSLDANQPYYYTATEDGTLTIEMTYCQGESFDSSTNILFSNEEVDVPLTGVTTTTSGSYPTYTFEVTNGNSYYIYFTTPLYIMIDVTFTKASIPPVLITPEKQFTVDSESPLYVYTPVAAVPNFYFTVEDFSSNVFEGDDAKVAFATDTEGNNKVELTAILTSKNEYVYTGENLSADTPYYIVLLDEYAALNMTLFIEKYEEEQSPYGQIELDKPFTPTADQQSWAIKPETELDPVCLYTNSPVNLIADGLLTISADGTTDVTDGWTPVKTANGWAYNGVMGNSNEYIVTYTGSTSVTFTLKQEPAVAVPLATPTTVYIAEPEPAIYVYWTEAIQQVDPDFDIDGYFEYPGYDAAEDMPEVISGSITSFNPDTNTDYANNAIMFAIKDLVAQYGAGEYSLTIYEDKVMNSDYASNAKIEETFEVEALPTPSPAVAVVNVSGDQITVTWTIDDEQQIVKLNEEIAAESSILIVSTDWAVQHQITIGEGATLADNTLTIDLTKLNLEVDVEYSLIIPEHYFFIGEDGDLSEPVDEEFKAKASAVNSLNAVEGDAVIYNLQGQKVTNPTKGIYIINGKKVIL